MATTKITSIKSTESKALAYIADPKKTDNGRLIYTFCCDENPIKASKDFDDIRATGTGRNTVLSRHMIISFLPGEIIPERALELGKEICRRFLNDEYQYYLAVHKDKEHIHLHCIFNNTNMVDGLTFNYHEDQGKKSERAWKKLREISDEVCKENLLSVIPKPEYSKGKSHYEWEQKNKNQSWKEQLKRAIDKIVDISLDFNDFLDKCREQNIDVFYDSSKEIDLKFRLPGQQRYTRAKTLGWFYESEQIAKRISTLRYSKSYVPKTKIRVTTKPEIQQNKFIRDSIDVKNMNEVSRALDTIAEYGANQGNLDEEMAVAFGQRMEYVQKLDSLNKEIKELLPQIKIIQKIEELKSVADGMEELTGFKLRRYRKAHSSELNEYAEKQKELRKYYPEGVVAPPSEALIEYRQELQEKHRKTNSDYKKVKQKCDDLTKAKVTIEKYLENERNIQRINGRGELE